MAHFGAGLHHFHLRKRFYQRKERFPHPERWKRLLDHAIYLVIFLGPVLTIPQLTEVWVARNAAGVSVISFSAYVILNVFWLTYGIAHREKPIVISALLWALVNGLVAVGAVLYGAV